MVFIYTASDLKPNQSPNQCFFCKDFSAKSTTSSARICVARLPPHLLLRQNIGRQVSTRPGGCRSSFPFTRNTRLQIYSKEAQCGILWPHFKWCNIRFCLHLGEKVACFSTYTVLRSVYHLLNWFTL